MDVTVRARIVTVTGPRGKLIRNFRHMSIVLKKEGKKTIRVDKWFGNRKELAAVRTVCSHIQNMIKGVTLVSGVCSGQNRSADCVHIEPNFMI